jgi:uncharacterized protein
MKIFADISFSTRPLMFAAWPGMGNVGLIATDYLRNKLGAAAFAEIDMSPFFIPDSIIVKDGIAQLPDIPKSQFYFVNNPDVIIFESNAQIGGRDGIALIKNILDLARQFNVSHIYTAAALVQPMTYQAASQVLVACNRIEHCDSIIPHGLVPMPDGYIAGLNGLLLGIAASRGIDSACFLGTMPTYASNMLYPKASLEIIKVFQRLLKITLNLDEIETNVDEMNQQLGEIEDRIKQIFPGDEDPDEEMSGIEEEKVPHYIMEKIERLFEKTKADHSAAPELKKELDRWNLYELYENRFLDLFENNKDADR